ncbi:unnamed protein product [Amoebophrya sp. A120]|nr:unnamed protein product [Amoebophrya sp. A120]|eukprot:GSA120T00017430001.1
MLSPLKPVANTSALQYDYARGLPWMVLLMFQFAVQPIVTQHLSGDYARRDPVVNPRVMVLLTEGSKIFFSLAGLAVIGKFKSSMRSLSWETSVVPAFIPSVSYSLQNIFIYLAMLSLDPVVSNLLNPTKVAFTVFFTYFILGRRTNAREMVAVLLLFCAVVLLRLTEAGSSTPNPRDAELGVFTLGFVYALGAAFLSGFGSAMCERSMLLTSKSSVSTQPKKLFSGNNYNKDGRSDATTEAGTDHESKTDAETSKLQGTTAGSAAATSSQDSEKEMHSDRNNSVTGPSTTSPGTTVYKLQSNAKTSRDRNRTPGENRSKTRKTAAGTASEASASATSSRAASRPKEISTTTGTSDSTSSTPSPAPQGKKNAYLFSLELSCATFSLTALQILGVYAYDLLWLPPQDRMALFPSKTVHIPELLSCVPLLLQASGGIVVGQVTKYVGGVAKGFTIVCGIVLTAVLNVMLQGRYPSQPLVGAVGLVILSVYLQATAASRPGPAKLKQA